MAYIEKRASKTNIKVHKGTLEQTRSILYIGRWWTGGERFEIVRFWEETVPPPLGQGQMGSPHHNMVAAVRVVYMPIRNVWSFLRSEASYQIYMEWMRYWCEDSGYGGLGGVLVNGNHQAERARSSSTATITNRRSIQRPIDEYVCRRS